MIYLCTYKSASSISHWFYNNGDIYYVYVSHIPKFYIYKINNMNVKRFAYRKYVPDRVWDIVEVAPNVDIDNIVLNKILNNVES
jgi:hypothetical protein